MTSLPRLYTKALNMDTFLPLQSFLFVALIATINCLVDMNIRQLQMIADHLTEDECTHLIEALHQSSFEPKEFASSHSNSDTPCIGMLLTYDRTVGFGQSFDVLAFRLGQIGRGDLSDRLSKVVYEEKAYELDKYFLNDPYKNSLPQESLLLDKSDLPKPDINSIDETFETGREFSDWEIASIVCSGLVIICFVLCLIYYLFGDAICRICRNYAPDFIKEWAHMVSGEIKWFIRQTIKNYKRDIIGSKAKVDDRSKHRECLMELNKNLNCYLHHGSLDAQDYFEEIIQRYKRIK